IWINSPPAIRSSFRRANGNIYIVDRTVLVEPTAVEVMASTGSPTVTLISCYPYLVDNQRIVVFARLQN
ncbi:MAG: sortase, partial [Anaerolineales bacterium]|nr:sortase [Anaerolineales bacterium]